MKNWSKWVLSKLFTIGLIFKLIFIKPISNLKGLCMFVQSIAKPNLN